MKKIFGMVLFVVAVTAAQAADNSMVGTHGVEFEPMLAQGNLQGCSLVYRAVQLDRAYLNGAPVMLTGNITIGLNGTNMGLAFKVGLTNLLTNEGVIRPNFAYLKSKKNSTAHISQKTSEGEGGHSFTVYSYFDPEVQGILDDILKSKKVTVAFNRKDGGLDVLVPIELDVADSTYPKGDTVLRVRSGETMKNFMGCHMALLDQAMKQIDKKK